LQQGVRVQANSEAASSLKLTLHAYEARSLIEIDKEFVRMANDHEQALVIFADVLTVAYEKRLADLALENRLPTIFGFREFADLGGLISYGSSLKVIDATGCRVRGQDFKRRQS
jgi:putative tryptophan/tyrosine transport system substrate-binding protein